MVEKKDELKLLLLGVLKRKSKEEEKEIERLVARKLDWASIIGISLHHRLLGYLYFGLLKNYTESITKELRLTIESLVLFQKEQSLVINNELCKLLKEFDKNNLSYAGLKGIIYNADLYPLGTRRSNDVDLLIPENELAKADEILRSHGYIQSFLKNGELKEASRKEKLIQRMNYHDLVPYCKKINDRLLDIIRIDINFHFDSRDNRITEEIFEQGVKSYSNGSFKINGLIWETHFAQLCVHFFREATDTLWTDGRRDITLYKIVDLINTLRLVDDKDRLTCWVNLIKSLNLQKACYYTLFHINQFYHDENVKFLLPLLQPGDTTYLSEIHVTGQGDTIKKREESFFESAFSLMYSL